MATARAPRAPGWLPLLGHTVPLLLRRTRFTSSLHRYGDLVEVHIAGRPGYVVTDKELVHQVLVADAGNYERGRVFDKLRPFMGNGLVTSTGARHRRQRRMVQPAFHRREISGYVASMVRAATELVDSWQAGESRPIDDDMQLVAGTVVARALFSDSLDAPRLREFLRCNRVLVSQSTVRAMSPGLVGALPLPANRRFDRAVEHVRRTVREVVAERRARPDGHSDLLSVLLAARDEDTGRGMTDEEVHDEVVTLFVAGVETASRVLAWAFHELGRRPDVESRVVAEVDEVLRGRPVEVGDLPELTCTRRVVNEVLRHYGPWLLMRRPVTDVELGGVRLAAGTELIISPHALHHDPRSFPEPERFDPDRWLPERAADVPRHAFIPFAAGVHQCLGSNFALAEITVVLATVLARVRLVPVPGKPVRELVTNVPVPSRLPMTVVPRAPRRG
ncbi:cytochrome P450 [Actinosynnema sp. NPDC053489]|uniref:cytochrome P450 n=1 Tax=Actinosynnema sp. NPDC053489 TaxID=3363916 RepID=UPI0037C6D10B